MTLLIDELYPGVVFEQNFRIKRSIQVAYFRPWLIKWGTPSDGELVCQILKEKTKNKQNKCSRSNTNSNSKDDLLIWNLEIKIINSTLSWVTTEPVVKYFWKLELRIGSKHRNGGQSADC